MRTMRRNKQTIQYAQLIGEEPQYVLDSNGEKVIDYIDEDGNIYYQEKGGKDLVYSDPVSAEVNIAFSGGEVTPTEFGVDASNYDATLIYDLNELPINETSLIWYKTVPGFVGDHVNYKNADYRVLSVKPSLNYTKVLLGKLVK